jgi:hypothetical protein
VKARVAEEILTGRIPERRDIMLVSIAEQCRLLEYLLSATQLDSRKRRIYTYATSRSSACK